MVREFSAILVLVAALAFRAGAEPPLPETRLPLHLVGTVVSPQPERSIAVIDSSGVISVVRAGDEIGGARVEEIRKDGVVLALSGRLERLALAGTASASTARGSGNAATSASAPSRGASDPRDAIDPDSPAARPPARARVSASARAARGPNASEVPASAAFEDDAPAAASAEQLLVTLSGQARYAPVQDASGKLRGVALMDVRPDSTLERIGLRSGDVVISVAGVKVDNTPRAFDALRALDPRAGGEVLIERQGVPTRIAVPPGAL